MNEKQMRFVVKSQSITKALLAKVVMFIALFFTGLAANAGNVDLNNRVTLKVENESIKSIFQKIEKQVDVHFMYESNQINSNQKISLKLSNVPLEQALDKICSNFSLRYEIVSNNIVIKKNQRIGAVDQNKLIISGTVYGGDDNMPLPGVGIKDKTSDAASSTDFDGTFKMEVTGTEATLVFSYVGYVTQEVKVTQSQDITVKLVADMKQLQEVVVMGYGSVKKNEVLGAVGAVSMKESSSRTYNSASELLQGTVAGVTVINSGGDPTAEPTINIRGIGSLNAETPLIVLDGIIYSGSLNTLNPNDIASISVLKDAASAAIYGARASGGVILITSKKGISDRINVNVNYQGGFQNVAKKLGVLNAAEYSDAMNTARDNAGLPRIPAFDTAFEPTARTTKTNWMDEIFQTGEIQDLSISINGKTEKSNFFLSGSYRKNEGILLNTFGERYTARANSSFKLAPNFTVGENLSYSLTNGQSANTSSGYTGAILAAVFYPPNATIYREDGSGQFGGVPEKYIGSYGDVVNPVAYLKRLDNRNPISTILINPYAEWEIVPGLKVKSNWGYTRIQDNAKDFAVKITEPGKIFDFNRLTQKSITTTDLLGEQTISYEKSFGKHNFKALAGYTYQETKREFYTIEGTGFDNEDPSQRYLLNAKLIQQTAAGLSDEIISSYVGRLNYDFNQKYLFSGIIRRDGTSKLLSENRWKVYPSVSAGWLISEEEFMKSLNPIVSNLKLRASWGQIGNLGNLGPYQFSVPLVQTSALIGSVPTINYGYAESELSNPNLKWESSEQTNIGLDFTMLNSALTGSVDAYVKRNKDMLVRDQLPGVSGTPQGRIVNSGDVENKGIEASLTYQKTRGEFKFDITANAAFLSNKIVSIKDDLTSLEPLNISRVRSLPLANIYQVGSPVGAYYGYSTDGLFQSTAEAKAYVNNSGVAYQPNAVAGDMKFKDVNGDGVINNSDRVVLGNPFPKTTYSLNMNFRYKGFDMNVFFNAVSGNKVFNAVKYTGLNASFPGYNLLSDSKDAWSPTNTDTNIPVLSSTDNNNNFGRISDFYIEDASFIRLKNLSIGYTVKDNWLNGKAKLRFFISGQNLFTITKYSGMDPEVGLSNFGLDLGKYPLSRIYMTGVNATF
ncbi:SusC/RagA family TonB-linked outer membrane protein [Flavobacterium sp. ANB]|uniref:SusC/RagA family TonB-linked outer membrane protein n=1 Tax=unclassified Flavobacterium TaxID=196869 RepID=UPI0012B84239|nr:MULTISPECIES: SusC/RagA family TonB-linked outer membrane protein [unclassified Flavobacterium]MBF4516875.1 SusC/RagA family TonB-linked outer membrane protein [Flavobacterium sp. ANB]MTD69229.1 SusC/RagA family TonB-linked outer membrane protein [Flavobacterium sp. LC2016-13]